MPSFFIAFLLSVLAHTGYATPQVGRPVETAAADHGLPINGNEVSLRTLPGFTTRLPVTVIPGCLNLFTIEDHPVVRVLSVPEGFELSVTARGLVISALRPEVWGYAEVETADRRLVLTLFSAVPASSIRDGKLDGYNIGRYRDEPFKGLATYDRPKGFIRLTPDNRDAWVSDRYRLRDFQCKLDGAAKFLLLRTPALIKLELLQQRLADEKHLRFPKFTIMSGFRTPYYNSRIGNETSYSRHLYGDAMDIYVDTNGDATMDDLNHDGRVDQRDAALLFEVAKEIDDSSEWGWLKGGAGVYRANSAHGPFLHIDTRGYVARWGVVE